MAIPPGSVTFHRSLGAPQQANPDKRGHIRRNGPRIDCFREATMGPAERLDSWKAIAAYLKRDERTVRRWEKEGLPVHRHVHAKKASVYAYPSEIDAWWNAGRTWLE